MNPESTRSAIFEKIRSVTLGLKVRAPLPEYDLSLTHSANRLAGGTVEEVFCRNLSAVHGRPMGSLDELAGFLGSTGQTHGYCDPELFASIGRPLADSGLTVETEYDRSRYDDYQFGITRATGAIAESGTIILDDEFTSHRLAALSPWVHVAVIDRTTIHRTISDALARLGDSPNIIWCTGPSKTADVEGILIEGVHGPGEQIGFLV